MAIPKGYKFTEEQLKARRKKKKGKWSKPARARQAIRMQERWKAKKKENGSTGAQGKVSTIGQRLCLIEHQIQKIREQLA